MLTDNEKYKLIGYIDLIEKSKPNGRYAHTKANKLTALRGYLYLEEYPSEGIEEDIKTLIHNLYEEHNA